MKDSPPYFSVVVPVYNRAHVISTLLDSLVQQKFKNFEVIIVDDGSTDFNVLEQKISEYTELNIRLFSQDNSGAGSARNVGIMESKGQYVALLDSDDLFTPEKLKLFHSVISKEQENFNFFYSRFFVEKGVGKRWIKPEKLPIEGQRIDEYLTCTSGWIQTSTMVVKREIAQNVKFSYELPSSQDTDFAIRCYLTGAKFLGIEQPLVVMNDIYDPLRVSKQKNVLPLISWAKGMESHGMSSKSVKGYIGWQCSRIVSHSNFFKALSYYIPALFSCCYNPMTALRIFAQISISEKRYQKIMAYIVRIFGRV